MSRHNKNYVNIINQIIKQSKNIAIIAHKDPDGDCLGSLLGWRQILYEQYGKDGKVIEGYVEGEIPDSFKFLSDISTIRSTPSDDIYDVVFVLDASDLNRIGIMNAVFNQAKVTVCIDHHVTNKGFCEINLIDPSASSTGELVYELAQILDMQISPKSAEGLYTAILTDTGKFTYNNTSPKTMRYAAEMMDMGILFSEIASHIYGSEIQAVYQAKSKIQSNVAFYFGGRLSLAIIERQLLEDHQIKMKDIDGVVETIRDIKGVQVACLIKEVGTDKTKVSLRSKGQVNVSEISSEFGGGGHPRAAGFNLECNLAMSIETVLKAFQNLFGE